MSTRFPVIESKKTLMEEEDYNFVNKGQKKKVGSGNPLELIEELKRKIEEQKKEIDNRNITIQGLQRNFESLSVIVKTEKTQSAMLRAELENLKLNAETGDRRAMQFHQKCVLLQKQCKQLRDQLKQSKRSQGEYSQLTLSNEELQRKIGQLQQTNQRLHSRLMQSDSDKKLLENEAARYKVLEKERRVLNERVIDLEDEIKRLADVVNTMGYKQTLSEEEVARYKNEVAAREKKIEEYKMRYKDVDKQRERLEFEVDYLKKENMKLNAHIEEKLKLVENTELYGRLKAEQQQRLNRQYRTLIQQYHELEQQCERCQKEADEKGEMLNLAQSQIDSIRADQQQSKARFRTIETEYQYEIQKLTKALGELHGQLNQTTGQFSELRNKLSQQQQRTENYNYKMSNLYSDIDEMNRQMQEHQERYGHYLKMIAENQPDVIITNEREMAKLENSSTSALVRYSKQIEQQSKHIGELEEAVKNQKSNTESMRRYIKSLQQEVSQKAEELLQKTRAIRKYEDEETELNRMIDSEKRASERLKREAEEKILERMRQLQNEKMRSKKQIEQQKERLEAQLKEERERNAEQLMKEQQKLQSHTKMLEEYKREEQQLRQMMARQKQELSQLSSSKQQQIERLIKEKQQDLQREKKNNKLLWSDNKKLKDLQNRLREDSTKLLEEKQRAKKEEIDRLKRQLERKYKDEVRGEETNSYELKRILQEKSSQFKILTEDYNKLKSEGDFYRNRNKELQGVVSRLERQFKDKTADLERENKSNKMVIETLDRKLKDFESTQSQLQKKQKKQLKLLYAQIEQMRQKARNQKVEQKLALVNKSMGDLDTSLKTLMNTMSCNYCVEVVRECVRLECGHIYCKKCKAGYEPNCGQCKNKSTASQDKMIDDSVSKAQYMRILINTIKDDLSKISQ